MENLFFKFCCHPATKQRQTPYLKEKLVAAGWQQNGLFGLFQLKKVLKTIFFHVLGRNIGKQASEIRNISTFQNTPILFLISFGLIFFSFGVFQNTPKVLLNKTGLFQNKAGLFQNNPRLLTSNFGEQRRSQEKEGHSLEMSFFLCSILSSNQNIRGSSSS